MQKEYPRYTAGIGHALALLITLTLFTSGCTTLNGSNETTVIRAKDKVAPALVHIRPVKEIYSRGKREEVLIIGSGFIISPDGYIVTNEHVAGESKQVRCVLSTKEEVEATVVGVDPYTDIAVLKLNVDHPLPYVKLGSSADLEAGQTVLALGSPHGLTRSVSLGIVSVTDRNLENQSRHVSPFNNWIQTDAAINPGNSGGPLVNLHGEVVGVNARMLSGAENVGFAIPIDIAKQVAQAIIKDGRVRRSWLGLTLQEMLARTDEPDQLGVVIADVAPLSPASENDVRPGDILIAVNNQSTNARFQEDLPPIRKVIADLPVGEAATLTLLRANEELEVSLTTEEKSELKGEELEFTEWGFTATDLTPQIIRRAQLNSKNGVLISGAQVGGIANNAGLTRGDIILKIDDEDVINLTQFRQRYNTLVETQKKLTMLVVKRGALTRFVLVQQEEENNEAIEEGSQK